jgi:hypothetical protein
MEEQQQALVDGAQRQAPDNYASMMAVVSGDSDGGDLSDEDVISLSDNNLHDPPHSRMNDDDEDDDEEIDEEEAKGAMMNLVLSSCLKKFSEENRRGPDTQELLVLKMTVAQKLGISLPGMEGGDDDEEEEDIDYFEEFDEL